MVKYSKHDECCVMLEVGLKLGEKPHRSWSGLKLLWSRRMLEAKSSMSWNILLHVLLSHTSNMIELMDC